MRLLNSAGAPGLVCSWPTSLNQDILYALLLSHTTLITLLRPKSHSIHPSDLHILLNTLSASSSLRTPNSESWLPICLPKFNAKGFVYACISYFEPASATGSEDGAAQGRQLGLGTVLITTNREGFFDMKAWKDAIAEVGCCSVACVRYAGSCLWQVLIACAYVAGHLSCLQSVLASGCVHSTQKLHARSPTSAGASTSLYARLAASLPVSASSAPDHSTDLTLPLLRSPIGETAKAATAMPPIPALRHYVYKSRTYVQITHPPFTGAYASSLAARRRLAGLYQRVHASLHETGAGGIGTGTGPGAGAAGGVGRSSGPMRLVYAVTADEAVLGMVRALVIPSLSVFRRARRARLNEQRVVVLLPSVFGVRGAGHDIVRALPRIPAAGSEKDGDGLGARTGAMGQEE